MQKYAVEDQYKINVWCFFKDLKMRQFFDNQTTKHLRRKLIQKAFIKSLIIIIVRFLVRTFNQELFLISMAFHLVHAFLLFRQHMRLSQLLDHIVELLLLGSVTTFQRESDSDFLSKQLLIFGFISLNSMTLSYNWIITALSSIAKYSIITYGRWFFVADYNPYKVTISICIIVFYQIMSIIVIASYQFSYKELWGNCEYLKKNNQVTDKLIHDLPVGIMLATPQGNVILQNKFAEYFLPPDVDIATHQYSGAPLKISQLLISKADKEIFEKHFHHVLEHDEAVILDCAIEGHPLPVRIHMCKQILSKGNVVQITITEKLDGQQLIYQRISQAQTIFNLANLAEVIQKEKGENSMILAMLPTMGKFTYQQSDLIVCNLRNYFNFFCDVFYCIQDIQFQFKISEQIPSQALVDIVRLHSILTQLINMLYQDHQEVQQLIMLSQRQIPNDGVRPHKESNIKLVILRVDMLEGQIGMSLDVDFIKQISDQKYIGKRLDLLRIEDPGYRIQQLKSSDSTISSLMHIIHQIYAVNGQVQFEERPLILQIQIRLPVVAVEGYQEIFLDDYRSVNRLEMMPQNKSEQNTQRIRSTQHLAPSSQRIPSKKDDPKGQTSVSELKLYTICKTVEVSVVPAQYINEEEKMQGPKVNSPGLSPIINKKGDVAILDLNEKLASKMHYIEKEVSKTIEFVMAEIANHRGKLNIRLHSSKKQRSFENSPVATQVRQISVPHVAMRNNFHKQPSFEASSFHPQKAQQPLQMPQNIGTAGANPGGAGESKSQKKSAIPKQILQNLREPTEQWTQVIVSNDSKSPQFQAEKTPTLNDIRQPVASGQSVKEISIDSKMYYNDIVTFLVIDQNGTVGMSLMGMKFSVPTKVNGFSKLDPGMQALEVMLQKGKIYHSIMVSLNFPVKDGYEILEDIRQMEHKFNMPKQYVIGAHPDLDDEMKEKALKAGFDEAYCKPFTKPYIEDLIQRRK